uniref:Fido domain-containing protein n=1 Tax=Globodera rostochiensis TaxID=31243 RepID=A0A914IBC6_GLORO
MHFSVPVTETDDETPAEDNITVGSEERGRREGRERHTAVLRTDRHFSPFAGDRILLPILKDHQSATITLETILQLHKSILGRHIGAGVLRTHDVSVGDDFDAMDWDEVPAEMEKFVSWLNAEMNAGVMSAGELAARASHRFNAATQPAAAEPLFTSILKTKKAQSTAGSPQHQIIFGKQLCNQNIHQKLEFSAKKLDSVVKLRKKRQFQ